MPSTLEQGQDATKPSTATAGSSRRTALKAMLAGAGGVAAAGRSTTGWAQTPETEPGPAIDPAVNGVAEYTDPATPPAMTTDRSGSDFMIDVLKSLDVPYVAANPGSSFRGLHESLVNYGGNKSPELLTCLHEETSVAMAAGYGRITGRPMAAFLHSTVGVQHGAMSIYHAFADRAPALLFCGNTRDAATRRPGVEWVHSMQDNAAIVRDCLKWDDQPASLAHFAESTVRAHRLAQSAPMGPVMIAVDVDLQEEPLHGSEPPLPSQTRIVPPVADSGSITELARMLVAAETPVIVADRYARTDRALPLLVMLAEVLGAGVVDLISRFNFPTRHPLNQTGRQRQMLADADVILVLEPVDLWGLLNRFQDQLVRSSSRVVPDQTKICAIGVGELLTRSNYQDFQRYAAADLSITGDAEASLPALIEAVRGQQSREQRRMAIARTAALTAESERLRERDAAIARIGWNSSPITTARLCAELWEALQGEDWALCGHAITMSGWPERLWEINHTHQYLKGLGAAGVGTGIGVAVGAALAHRPEGRLAVNIQTDGDLLYAPGALWTAAHHRIPLLSIMHNNRAYHQEVMHIQRMANRHERGVTSADVGTAIDNPAVDFSGLAKSFGVWSSGLVTDPRELQPALRRAIEVVKRGEPALVDVLMEPR